MLPPHFSLSYQDLDALEWNTFEDKPEDFVDAAVSKSGRMDGASERVLSRPFSKHKTHRVFDGSYRINLAIYHQHITLNPCVIMIPSPGEDFLY